MFACNRSVAISNLGIQRPRSGVRGLETGKKGGAGKGAVRFSSESNCLYATIRHFTLCVVTPVLWNLDSHTPSEAHPTKFLSVSHSGRLCNSESISTCLMDTVKHGIICSLLTQAIEHEIWSFQRQPSGFGEKVTSWNGCEIQGGKEDISSMWSQSIFFNNWMHAHTCPQHWWYNEPDIIMMIRKVQIQLLMMEPAMPRLQVLRLVMSAGQKNGIAKNPWGRVVLEKADDRKHSHPSWRRINLILRESVTDHMATVTIMTIHWRDPRSQWV